MKIAVVSDDGINISQHFGRAPLYVVMTIEGSKIIGKEPRSKEGHHSFATTEHYMKKKPVECHGYDAGSQAKHSTMAEVIADCQVLLAGGMGWGAYESMKNYNIIPVVTDVQNIDEAAKLYLEGKLPNLMDRLH